MDMSIGKKRPVNQLGAFEKPRILVVALGDLRRNKCDQKYDIFRN
jgi:hypothetical protein